MGNPSEHHVKTTLAELFYSSPAKSTAHTNIGSNNNHLNPQQTTYVTPSSPSPSPHSKKTFAPPFTKILSSTGNNIRSLSRKLSSKHVRDVYINHSGSLLIHPSSATLSPSINRHHVQHHESYDNFNGDDGVFHDQYNQSSATNNDYGDLIGPIDDIDHVNDPIDINVSTIKPAVALYPSEDCVATESSVPDQVFEPNHHPPHEIDDAMLLKEKEKEREKRRVQFRDSIRYILVSNNDVTAVSSARNNPELSNDSSMEIDHVNGDQLKSLEEEIQDMMLQESGHGSGPASKEESVQGMNNMMKKSASVGLFGKVGFMAPRPKWKKSGHYFSQELGGRTRAALNWALPGKKRQYYSQELGMVTARQAGLAAAAKSSGQVAAETWQETGAGLAGSHGHGDGEGLQAAPLDLAEESRGRKQLAVPPLDLAGPLDLAAADGRDQRALLMRRGGGRGRESGKKIKVYIEEGMIGLGWQDGVPVMLSAGAYEFSDSTHHGRTRGFSVVKKVSEKTVFVRHGNLNRLRIRDGGHLGVAWVDGRPPVLLHSGSVSLFSCHDFRFLTTSDDMLSLKEFTLGPFRIVNVADHEIGVKFCNRKPEVLKPGRHYLSMTKLEVFAGFESLLKRQSKIDGVIATSKDDMKVIVDIFLEWQIKAEDATFARLANISDVETVVCEKTRRAFHLVMWDTNAQDLQLELVKQGDDVLQSTINTTSSSFKDVSSKVSRECMELFEEGWTITLWDLQLSNLIISHKSQFVQDNV